MNDIQTALKRCPVFAGFTQDAVEALSRASQMRNFRRGARIYDDQSHQNCLTVVDQGLVVFYALGPDGKEKVMTMLESGAWFGDAIFAPGLPRVMNVDARTDVRIVEVPETLFRDVLRQDPNAAMHVIDSLGRRFWALQTLFQDDAIHSIAARLVRRLILMNEFRVVSDGADAVSYSLTQDDLAQILGMTRQGLRPTLRQLEEQELLTFSYGAINIPSLSRLRDYLAEELATAVPVHPDFA